MTSLGIAIAVLATVAAFATGQPWHSTGRKVLDLKPGPNNIRRVATVVYFVQEEPQAVRKVILAK